MKLIIAGSRNLKGHRVYDAINSGIREIRHQGLSNEDMILHGCAEGVDTEAGIYAKDHFIPVKEYPPQYRKFGRKAPLIRNSAMARDGDALLLVWDGKSRGAAHMLSRAIAHRLPVVIRILYPERHNGSEGS